MLKFLLSGTAAIAALATAYALFLGGSWETLLLALLYFVFLHVLYERNHPQAASALLVAAYLAIITRNLVRGDISLSLAILGYIVIFAASCFLFARKKEMPAPAILQPLPLKPEPALIPLPDPIEERIIHQPEPFFIDHIIRDAIRHLESCAALSSVKIESRGDSDIAIFHSPNRFREIVSDLLSKAIDSYEGKEMPEGLRKVVLSTSLKNKVIFIEIIDSGKGEEADFGSAKGIIEKEFSGSIRVETVPGTGTRFVVAFPQVMPPEDAAPGPYTRHSRTDGTAIPEATANPDPRTPLPSPASSYR